MDTRTPPLHVRAGRGLRRWAGRFNYLGIVTGWLFLCLSMTPSLLPRGSLLQGLLSGIALAFGYADGESSSEGLGGAVPWIADYGE